VIGFTASAFTDETERCRKAGMDDVLSKPLVRAELERALHRAVFADHTRLAPLPERALETDDAVRLDRALLEELQSLGAPQYIASLLDQFMSDARERLEQLASAIESADHIKLRELAHALRGSAAGIGAKRLAALATRLEADSDGRMPADPRRRLLELREEYALLTAELAALVTSAAASGF
jgi:HPt (histidine-containing phosphotransfer) domain-containing protein